MSAKKLNVKRHASNAVLTLAALVIFAACELLFINTLSDVASGPAVYSDYLPAQSPCTFPHLPTSNDQAPHAQANRAGLDLLAEVGQ